MGSTKHSLLWSRDETDPCTNHSHACPEEGRLQRFAKETSLHGLVHVVNKEYSGVRYHVWTYAFIGCASLFVYLSISSVLYYFHFHHISKLEEKEAFERTFPAFTFCNINPLRKSTLTACDIEHLRAMWDIPAEHTENITSPVYEMNMESFKYPNGTKAEPPFCGKFNWKKLYDRSAHRLWDMVKSCRFQKAHCTAEDFESDVFKELAATEADLVCAKELTPQRRRPKS